MDAAKPGEDCSRSAFGFSFHALDLSQIAAVMRQRAASAPFVYAVTPNVDHVVRLHDRADPHYHRFIESYATATWRLCDSRVLARLARLRGVTLPVAAGSDLTQRLFDTVIEPGDVICVVGGNADMAAMLRRNHPELLIHHYNPPMGMKNNPEAMKAAAEFVESCAARFTFLAVGSPQQEMLAALIAERGKATGIGLCVGAAVSFLTGHSKRAPLMMRQMGLEWVHRLLSDPKRLWRRYLIEGPRIFTIAMSDAALPAASGGAGRTIH